jgi:hypothetical protein
LDKFRLLQPELDGRHRGCHRVLRRDTGSLFGLKFPGINSYSTMLTLDTMLKAMRQMLSYGELKTGAMDFMPSRITGGHRDEFSHDSLQPRKGLTASSGYVRRWDKKKGAYVYVRKD